MHDNDSRIQKLSEKISAIVRKVSDQDLLLSLSIQLQLVDIALDQGQNIVRYVDIRTPGAPPAAVGDFGNMLYLEMDRGGANSGQRDEAIPIEGACLKIDAGLSVNNRHATAAYIMQNNFRRGGLALFGQRNGAFHCGNGWGVDSVILPFLYTQQRFRNSGKEGVASFELDFLDSIAYELNLHMVQKCNDIPGHWLSLPVGWRPHRHRNPGPSHPPPHRHR